MSPAILIRTARLETDLPEITRIINAFEPEPVTPDQVRTWFQHNPPGRIQLRLVALDENEAITGYSGFVHEASAPERHFKVWVLVDPAHHHQGIGAALWDETLSALQNQGATRLESDVPDNDPVSLGFAGRRGFRISHQHFHSHLDLTGFDESPYQPAIAALESQGIRFCTLADFPDTPETRHQLYHLNATNDLDIPNQDGDPIGYPEFEKFVLGAPWFKREGQLLALDGNTWAGLAAVSLTPETQSAYNLHTGVLRAYRGRGIALALKIMAIRYARQHGAREIGTDNDTLNQPMLAINRKLGYQHQSGRYILVCWLADQG